MQVIEAMRTQHRASFDVIEREVYSTFLSADKAVVDISSLMNGVYIIQFVNSNGQKKNMQLLKE